MKNLRMKKIPLMLLLSLSLFTTNCFASGSELDKLRKVEVEARVAYEEAVVERKEAKAEWERWRGTFLGIILGIEKARQAEYHRTIKVTTAMGNKVARAAVAVMKENNTYFFF